MNKLDSKVISDIKTMFSTAASESRQVLYEYEVYKILTLIDIEPPEYEIHHSIPDVINIKSDEIVAKLVSRDCLHKSDIGAVKFLRNTKEEISKAFTEIKNAAEKANCRFEGVLYLKKIIYESELGREILVSFKHDDAFGPVIALGIGGIWTEFYGKMIKNSKAIVLRPTCLFTDEKFADEQFQKMLAQFALTPILEGKERIKRKLLDTSELISILKKFILLAEYFSPLNPELKTDEDYVFTEFEVNPFVISDQGNLYPVDALVTFNKKGFIIPEKPLEKLEKLFNPQTGLVIGVSAKDSNPGSIILQNLIKSGAPKDKLVVLHPKEKEILGVRCISQVDDLPDGIDLAIITIPATEMTVNLIGELVEKNKIHTLIIITGGFGEIAAGSNLQSKLEEIIINSRKKADGGVLVNGPNCLGIISKPGNYDTFFLPSYLFPKGENQKENLAIVSQSGAFIAFQKAKFQDRIIPRYCISIGNQIDITFADYLEFLGKDDNVDLYSFIIEGFRSYDGRKFAQIAQKLRKKGKQILVWKSAKSKEGAQAAQSHTAAIAGDYDMIQQTFECLDLIEPKTQQEHNNIVVMFTLLAHKKISGNRIGIIGNAGFDAAVASDNLGNLTLAQFTDETNEKIKALLPGGFIDVHNPIDTTPQCPTKKFAQIIKAVADDPNVDCIIASPTPITQFLDALPASPEHNKDISKPDSLPSHLIKLFQEIEKPLVVNVEGGNHYEPYAVMLEKAGIPVFRHIDQATRAMNIFITKRG